MKGKEGDERDERKEKQYHGRDQIHLIEMRAYPGSIVKRSVGIATGSEMDGVSDHVQELVDEILDDQMGAQNT